MVEMTKDLASAVRKYALREGADIVGVSSARSYDAAPKGYRPCDLMEGAKSVVSLAVVLPSAALENVPSREYSVSYTKGNDEANRIAFRLSRYLEDEGYRAIHVPASPPYDVRRNMGDLSHRHAAVLAGLGVLGKNSLLLNPKYGARIRLVSVITDAFLKPDKEMDVDLCGSCVRCIRACPAKALKGKGVVDKEACDRQHVLVGRRLQLAGPEQVCGVCISVCPVGKPVR